MHVIAFIDIWHIIYYTLAFLGPLFNTDFRLSKKDK